ncbi:MAG TPA: hypothetical protein PJ988_03230 [Anaerolinea sp.]|nr:hypothetical protein [Anaerolinea sp.]
MVIGNSCEDSCGRRRPESMLPRRLPGNDGDADAIPISDADAIPISAAALH